MLGVFLLSPSLQPAVINSVDIPWYTTPFFALLFALASLFYHNNKPIEVHTLLLLLATIATVPIVYHFSSESIYQQLFYIAFIFTALLLAVIGYNLDSAKVTAALYIFIIVAFIWAICGLIIWFDLITENNLLRLGNWALTSARSSKINGPFVNGNVFAIMMFCAWLTSLWFWLNKPHSPINIWLLSMIFFWSVGFLSLARGAWLVHLLPLVFAILYCIRQKEHLKILLLCLSITLAILTSFLGANTSSLKANTTNQLSNITNSQLVRLTREARPLLYTSIYEIWLDKPYWGVGYGEIKAHYLTAQAKALDKYQLDIPGLDLTSNGHNTILHLMAEIGLLGILLSFIVTLLLFAIVIRTWKNVDSYTWPIAMILSILWLQGLINITMTRPFPILFFTFLFGIAIKHYAWKRGSTYVISQRMFIIPLISVSAILLAFAIINTTSWRNYETWLTTKDLNLKKELTMSLLKNPATMPYVIGETARSSILQGSTTLTARLMPEIKKALKVQESKTLYQALFFSYVFSNNLTSACTSGTFIKKQHWAGEDNYQFYSSACDNTLDTRTLGIKQ